MKNKQPPMRADSSLYQDCLELLSRNELADTPRHSGWFNDRGYVVAFSHDVALNV